MNFWLQTTRKRLQLLLPLRTHKNQSFYLLQGGYKIQDINDDGNTNFFLHGCHTGLKIVNDAFALLEMLKIKRKIAVFVTTNSK